MLQNLFPAKSNNYKGIRLSDAGAVSCYRMINGGCDDQKETYLEVSFKINFCNEVNE